MTSKPFICSMITQFLCLLSLQGQLSNAHPFKYKTQMGLVDSEGNVLVQPKYKFIKQFNWPEVKYTLFQSGDSTGVMGVDGRIALKPGLAEPKIIGSFASYYDIPKKLLGLHIIDLDKGSEILTDDSLRFWDVINSTPPLLLAVHMQRKRNYLYQTNGTLITSCDFGHFQIVVPDMECPIFQSAPDEKDVYIMRYFDCHGVNIPSAAFKQKYPHVKSPSAEVTAGHESMMTVDGRPNSHAKSFPEQERIRVYKDSIPHPIVERIKQKLPEVGIFQVVQNSKSIAAIVFNASGKFGLVNAQGEYLISPVSMIEVEEAWLKVRQDARVGIVTIEGKEILPMKFLLIDCLFNLYEYSPYTFRVRTHSGYEGHATLDGKVFLPKAALE